jgi:hypothetical protein
VPGLAIENLDNANVDGRLATAVSHDLRGREVDLLGRGEPMIDVHGGRVARLHSRAPQRGGASEVMAGDSLVEASDGEGGVPDGWGRLCRDHGLRGILPWRGF